MTRPSDHDQRQRIRTSLDECLVVEAAAGTGKTSELVARIIAVLARGAQVGRLVAVTFTEKAAGELKLRLRTELDRACADPELPDAPRANLESALARLEEAQVSTIHGLCADLLRERTAEARVDPDFAVMQEGEARSLYRRAFRAWLEERLADPPEGLRRSLRQPAGYGETPTGRLEAAGWAISEWPDLDAPWRRPAFDRSARIDALLAQIDAFLVMRARASDTRDVLHLDTQPIADLASDLARAARFNARDDDAVEAALRCLPRDFHRARRGPPRDGRGKWYGAELARTEVIAARDHVLASLELFAADSGADLAALLHAELLETLDRYDVVKARAGKLAFLDLLLRTRGLLRDRPDVRSFFQARFDHVFVDEFQDTDPLQAEIVLLLTADDPDCADWRQARPAAGKLFIVGDPKQSIYRFRRADVGIYHDVRARLAARGAGRLELTTSFRAVGPIQSLINAAFAPAMGDHARGQQATYVPLAPHRSHDGSQPAVVALPVPEPFGTRGRVTATAIEASAPATVAAFVHWLVEESGWTVSERGSQERVAVQARHVCILFRRFESWGRDVTLPYVEALDAREMPHVVVGGKSYHGREEVEGLRAAMAAIERPDDELQVFATLKGSLFAIGDDALLEYRFLKGRLHPLRSSAHDHPEHLASVSAALLILGDLHRGRNGRPVADTIDLLLERTRAHGGFAFRPNGERVLANVLQLSHIARAHEEAGGISFRGFVEELQHAAEQGDAPEAPLLEDDSDGVRIMTVHRAKGLEFPVVIMADISCNMSRRGASRYVDPERRLAAMRIAGFSPVDLLEHDAEETAREQAEGVRVAYVAATRARDLLVISAVGNGPTDGWLAPLQQAIFPPEDRFNLSQVAPGCPPFGERSILGDGHGAPHAGPSVRPGLHSFRGYDVVWWDPAALDLAVEPTFGIRQQRLLEPAADADMVGRDRARHERWLGARQERIERGRLPQRSIKLATDATLAAPDPMPLVTVVELPRVVARPGGRRFGSLVHAVLATVPLDADAATAGNYAALQARLLGATDAEAAAAAEVTRSALAHPLLRRAAACAQRGGCRREVALTAPLPDGQILEGVVDLAFIEDDRWTVIDFKTDIDLEAALERYSRQVAHYARAITAATGQSAHPVLLRL